MNGGRLEIYKKIQLFPLFLQNFYIFGSSVE